MPLPVIAGVYRVTLNWVGPNGHAANVLHVANGAGTSAGAFSALDTNAAAAMWTLMSNTAICTSIDILPLDGSLGTSTFTPTAARWTGQSTGEANMAVAALVSWRTGLRGPAFRGRTYLPYISESVITTGFVNNASLTTTQAAWNTFRTAMATANYAVQVTSYVHAFTTGANAVIVESALATQRRRQDRLR